MYQQRQHLKPNPEGNCCHHALLQKQDHEGLPTMHLAKRAPVSERERLQSLRRVMAERVVGLVGLLSILRWRDQAPCNTESCDAACLDGSAPRGVWSRWGSCSEGRGLRVVRGFDFATLTQQMPNHCGRPREPKDAKEGGVCDGHSKGEILCKRMSVGLPASIGRRA